MNRFTFARLKKIRVAGALIFFFPISLLFIDPRNSIPGWASNFLTSLQFVPSVTNVLVSPGWVTLGLLFVLLLTVAFGRVYCSTICPLGIVQDFIIRIKKIFQRRKRFEYTRPPFVYHYGILALIAIYAIAGSMTLLNLFEPFSNFGRILTNTVEPVLTLINNGVADVLGRSQIYFIYNVPARTVDASVVIVPILFLGVLVYMSYYHGRLFCNSLCPAGAILSLISRLSLFKIVVDKHVCTECGACEKVCKANCIESGTKRIDFAACIGCFNCIRSCPTDGIVYRRIPKKAPEVAEYDSGRRKFFRELSAPATGLMLPVFVAQDSSATKSGYVENRKHPVTPPGSRGTEHFTNFCTACHLCVTACPTQVIYPSFLGYGITGIFQPKLNYDASYCNYDCIVCSQICPSGAIVPVPVEQKRLIQIGKAIFVRDDCVVVSKKKDCAACSEHCPTKAVHMVPYEGKLNIPELNNDICVGCGACEHACPTEPRKAIYVKANPVHLTAKKPQTQKQEKIFDSTQEFPF